MSADQPMFAKAGLFIIIAFLTVQTHTLLHMAEHEFEKHEHNGTICVYYLHGQLLDHADALVPNPAPLLNLTDTQAEDFASILLRTARFVQAAPRAPPVFS